MSQNILFARGVRLLLLLGGLLSTTEAGADPSASAPTRPSLTMATLTGGVPLPEIGVLGLTLIPNLALAKLRPHYDRMPDRPTISLDAFGDWDVEASRAVYSGPAPLHGQFPFYLGTAILPAAFLILYGSDAITEWASGRSWSDRMMRRHSPPGQSGRLLWGAIEAVSYSLLIQQIVQSVIRRDRPAVALLEQPDDSIAFGGRMSLYSGHASLAFSIAAYSSLHLGDLIDEKLRPMHPVPRALIARGLPSLALYGVATYVTYSRFADLAHFASDCILGAFIGGGIGNFFYLWHTRGRHARRLPGQLSFQGSGVSYSYSF